MLRKKKSDKEEGERKRKRATEAENKKRRRKWRDTHKYRVEEGEMCIHGDMNTGMGEGGGVCVKDIHGGKYIYTDNTPLEKQKREAVNKISEA